MFRELFPGAERERIQAVAWGVRREFESGLAYTDRLKRLYSAFIYNPGPEKLEAMFRQAPDLFPRLNCGIATVALLDSLGGQVSKDVTFLGANHTVLQLTHGIVDITADQYGGPKVYVGKLAAPWRVRRWEY